MTAHDWHLMALHDHHLQALAHGHEGEARRWLETPAASQPQALRDWMSWLLQRPLDEAQWEALPLPHRHIWCGWRDYYQGRLAAAAEAFYAAFSGLDDALESRQLVCMSALGLGKAYTRTGHWPAARGWLLLALNEARRVGRQMEILRGYGALSELLLRAGHTRAAHACMSTSYHLLPPGKGQQARQLNYLATTLMRSRQSLRAESLLMSARLSAKDNADTASADHALARLQFLRWDQQGADGGHILDELRLPGEECSNATTLTPKQAPAAAGFTYLGLALRSWQPAVPERRAVAGRALEQASRYFGDTLPMERAWANRLRQQLEGQPLQPCGVVQQCLALEPYAPPEASANVLDRTWQQLPLALDNAFAWLGSTQHRPADVTLESVQRQRQCFFI